MKKAALLDLLCSRNPDLSRKQHYARVLCGEIFVEGQRVRDPAQLVRVGAQLEHIPSRRYVSRGGEKLSAVLDAWKIDVRGKSFVDAGASTGGFSDCLLQRGAARVAAVEVGVNQLDYRLRSDRRVWVMERTNIMDVRTLPFAADAAVADLSLRSLRGAAAHVLDLVSGGWLLALVKPQYEWEKPSQDFQGVITRGSALTEILHRLFSDLQAEGVHLRRLRASELRGRAGNREFFCCLTRSAESRDQDLDRLIAAALHSEF